MSDNDRYQRWLSGLPDDKQEAIFARRAKAEARENRIMLGVLCALLLFTIVAGIAIGRVLGH